MSTLFGKKSSKRKRAREEIKNLTNSGNNQSDHDVVEYSSNPKKPARHNSSLVATHDYGVAAEATSFQDLGLAEPLVRTCRALGLTKPTPVQQAIIPDLLFQRNKHHILALSPTGSGKTAAFVLPILHHLSYDPVGIYAVVLTPTRELAQQIHQQVLALGSAYHTSCALVVGGLDIVQQACALDQRPHFCVATPGRLGALLRAGAKPPSLRNVCYLVLDEADRLLTAGSGFERDVAEVVLHCHGGGGVGGDHGQDKPNQQRRRRHQCQTLLFSATMTKSLTSLQDMAGAGLSRLPLKQFVLLESNNDKNNPSNENEKEPMTTARVAALPTKEQGDCVNDDSKDKDDDCATNTNKQSSSGSGSSDKEMIQPSTPNIPAGLKQEYIFMPSRVRDAYLLTAIRTLLAYGGRTATAVLEEEKRRRKQDKRFSKNERKRNMADTNDDDEEDQTNKARSAIIFVSTCERAALVSGILQHVGVDNVALHSLLSQNRRLAALHKFKSQHVRVLVATDVASRGLDIPTVDLVLNAELPRNPVSYVHRVGRTARAGRRGRAISLVDESQISLVHAAERISGRELTKCTDVTDDMALTLLGPVAKAARVTKLKLMEIGFDELVQKFKERKALDRKERRRIEKALRRRMS